MGADKFRLYRIGDWPKLPAMRWLIKGIIVQCGTTLLYGLPKKGKKSFIGISMACAVASGKHWCGFPTHKARVLYIVGEGFYGILRRQAAWEKQHGCSVDVRYFRVPINFFNPADVAMAVKALEDQDFKPDFIVIDTLARSMSGGKENDTENMNKVFELIENFRAELKTDGSILVIAHMTKDGLNYRGSSVQAGAVDGLIESRSELNSKDIELISHGFKDAAEFAPFKVRCEMVAIETEDGSEEVLAIQDRAGEAAGLFDLDTVSDGAAHLLSTLAQFKDGATSADWKKASGQVPTTFKRNRGELEKAKRITGGRTRGSKYQIAAQPKSGNGEGSLGSGLGPGSIPFQGNGPNGPNFSRGHGPYLDPSGPLDPSAGCKNSDTTELAPGVGGEDDLVAKAMKHLKVKPQRAW